MSTGVDQGRSPYTGEWVGSPIPHTTTAELDRVAATAAAAAPALAALPLADRAHLLRSVAGALAANRDAIVELADAETGLGTTRLSGELVRTRVQLEMFADAVTDGSFLDVVIDPPDPDALPAPRPDLRRMLIPLGPVAVFAASNFPLAFSVGGGDTASALAAGCPVVVKAHPSHPGLSALCARIVSAALAEAAAPEGTFAIVFGEHAGRDLVTHPAITAVGFTGSLAGGRALFDLAATRPDPIPFYGELGSLNPTVVTPGALAGHGEQIATGFVGSFLLGTGQFCTKPGMLFLPAEHGLAPALTAAIDQAALGPLLNERIRDRYERSAAELTGTAGVREVVAHRPVADGAGYRSGPTLAAVSAADLRANPQLLEERFGPAALVVEYGSADELVDTIALLPGSLTATLHADPESEGALIRRLIGRFATGAGRVIWDGWPTGVAVTWAMHHGGPWPATTAPLHTSVGVTAIRRFLRPVVYQNVPDAFLPAPLQAANPLGVPRRVNGATAP
ncbi:MAG TPA: aldehyde dehydrogenase (NADP(+)) [Actinomycetes bacterium]|nr:aldehyde dehydrogenase (NADP(+)) [Actinomycetes bacterium]